MASLLEENLKTTGKKMRVLTVTAQNAISDMSDEEQDRFLTFSPTIYYKHLSGSGSKIIELKAFPSFLHRNP